MRWVLLFLIMAFANAVLANLAWRIVGAKRLAFRLVGRTLGLVFGLANMAIAFFAFIQLWRLGWEPFYIAMLLLGLIFAFRFGGTVTGRYP